MKTPSLVASLSLSLSFLGCGTDDSLSAFEKRVADARDTSGAPGLSAAVITLDNIEVASAGVRRLGDAAILELDDQFHLGSLAKSMTSLIAASLVADGTISWTTTVDEIWPSAAAAGDPAYRGVTLAQLLQHRSRLPGFELLVDLAPVPDFSGDAQARRSQFAAWLLMQPPAVGAGEFQYSNAGYSVAAAMLEARSMKSWDQLLAERVFVPLELQNAGTGWPTDARQDAPSGHLTTNGTTTPFDDGGTPFPELVSPAGNVRMSASELGRYAQLHLRARSGVDDIYPAALVAPLHASTYPDLAAGASYGFGWLLAQTADGTISFHDGSADTFYASIVISPSTGKAAIVLANAASDPVIETIDTLVNELVMP